MLWYKPKFTHGVSRFIYQVLTTGSLLSRTCYSPLCTLGQRYDQQMAV